jgi:hypothetical protein
MKNFTINQMLWHQKAVDILTKKQAAESMAKVMGEMLEMSTDPVMKAMYQESGDQAAGEAMQLQVQYYEVLRKINEPIMFKEVREANTIPASAENAMMVKKLLTVVEAAEEHANKN